MEDELKELLEYLAKSLVDHPEDVDVVADIGKVIGKQGRIARALRTVVKASAIKNGKRALVEIVD
jgi:predicted RNA-binding protein YlqC (UPF0109 family)